MLGGLIPHYFCRCAQCAPNYEDTMVPHHKYVVNLNVKIDSVAKSSVYLLCYWNSKDVRTAALYNYCNKPFTCDGSEAKVEMGIVIYALHKEF